MCSLTKLSFSLLLQLLSQKSWL